MTNPFVQTAPLNLGGPFLDQRKQERFNKRVHSTLAIVVLVLGWEWTLVSSTVQETVSLFLCCAGSNVQAHVEGPCRAPCQLKRPKERWKLMEGTKEFNIFPNKGHVIDLAPPSSMTSTSAPPLNFIACNIPGWSLKNVFTETLCFCFLPPGLVVWV